MYSIIHKAPIRFAVVGCGHIGRRHCARVVEEPRACLVARCDIRAPEEILSDEERSDSIPYYRSVEALLASGIEFDIASICVPNGLHASLAYALMEAGHHVLIEKPIVLEASQGEALRALARAAGVRIYSVLQNRYTPSWQWLKRIVDGGSLGKIYHVQMQCLWSRDKRYYTPDSWHGDAVLDGGTLYTQYAHFVDLLLWLLGEIEVVDATFANYAHQGLIDFEDSGSIHFRAQGGTEGYLFYSTAVHHENLGIALTLLAEHGTIRLSGPYLNRLEHALVRGERLTLDPEATSANEYGSYSGSAQNHHRVIAEVVSDLLNLPATTTGLDEGLAVTRLIESIYRLR